MVAHLDKRDSLGPDATPPAVNRRKNHRFAATDRVEYDCDGKRGVSFLSNLSVGGMLLRSADDLRPGATVHFVLHLDGIKGGLAVEGRVVERGEHARAGTAVAFLPGEQAAEAALRAYVNERVIARLEQACQRPRPPMSALVDLASLYFEAQRFDEARAVFARGMELHPRNAEIYEAQCRCLLQLVLRGGADRTTAMHELEIVLERASLVAATPLLAAAAAEIAARKDEIEREAQEKSKRAEEEVVARRVTQAIDERLRDVQAAHASALAELKEKLEVAEAQASAERERTSKAEAQLEGERQAVAAERERSGELARQLEANDPHLAEQIQRAVAAHAIELSILHAQKLEGVRDAVHIEQQGLAVERRSLAEERRVQLLQRQDLEEGRQELARQRADIEASQRQAEQIVKVREEVAQRELELAAVEGRLVEREAAVHGTIESAREMHDKALTIVQANAVTHAEVVRALEEQRHEKNRLEQLRKTLEEQQLRLDEQARVLSDREGAVSAREAEGARLAAELERTRTEQDALTVEQQDVGRSLVTRRQALDEEQAIAEQALANLTRREETVAQSEAEASHRGEALAARAVDLEARERLVGEREVALHASEVALHASEAALRVSEAAVERRTEIVETDARALSARLSAATESEEQLVVRQAELHAKAVALEAEIANHRALAAGLRTRTTTLEEEDAQMRAREEQLARKAEGVDDKARSFAAREDKLAGESTRLEARAREVDERMASVAARALELDARAGALDERQSRADEDVRRKFEAGQNALVMEAEELGSLRAAVEAERAALALAKAAPAEQHAWPEEEVAPAGGLVPLLPGDDSL